MSAARMFNSFQTKAGSNLDLSRSQAPPQAVTKPLSALQRLCSAEGRWRRALAFMEREPSVYRRRAIKALGLASADHVLDIGCGAGRSLAEIAAEAPDGCVFGADSSDLLAQMALRRNRHLVEAHRADVVVASAASLPFEDGAFDKALCLDAIYFWNDLSQAFGEIARVMKRGGRMALIFRTSSETPLRAFPAEVCCFLAQADVIAPLEASGFAVETRDELPCMRTASPVLLVATKTARRARIRPHTK